MKRRFRLTLGYRGTRYAGWAVQHPSVSGGRPTVQGALEDALGRSLGHPVRVTAAGRTDAGVHADGQVVSFDTASGVPAAGLRHVLARWLPDDVWLVDASAADADFDARRSAVRRWYRYAIWRRGAPSASWQGRCVSNDRPLNLAAMRRASRHLLGRHDFAAVAARPLARASTERTVFAADWLQISESLLIFEVCADAYLKQMVRTLVGTLLWVGAGRWTPEQFALALTTSDRRRAGPSAPAAGLSLHRIDY